jgi:hypothetical protein
VLKSDSSEVIDFKEGNIVTKLRELLDGGYLENVHPKGLPRPYCMVADEEGLIKGLEHNLIGSIIYGGMIVGTVVVLKEVYKNGSYDWAPLEEVEAKRICKALIHTKEQIEKDMKDFAEQMIKEIF